MDEGAELPSLNDFEQLSIETLEKERVADALFAIDWFKKKQIQLESYTFTRSKFAEVLDESTVNFGKFLSSWTLDVEEGDLPALSNLLSDQQIQDKAYRLQTANNWFKANYYLQQPFGLSGYHDEPTRNIVDLARCSLICKRPEFAGKSLVGFIRNAELQTLKNYDFTQIMKNVFVLTSREIRLLPQWEIFGIESEATGNGYID